LGDNAPSFYLPGQKISYDVSVTDPDGTAIDPKNIFVSVDYLEGMDKVAMNLGHQQVSAAVTGKALTQALDCKTCHKKAEASIGPNYKDVAMKYKDQRNGLSYLQRKIVAGGSGVWGEVMMPAHPKITSDESRQIAMYIQSLAGDGLQRKSLPAKGTITAEPSAPGNTMVITTSYTDQGEEGTIPLTGSKSVAISSSTVPLTEDIKTDGMQALTYGGMDLLLMNAEKGRFELPDMSLNGVNALSLRAAWQSAPGLSFEFEIHEGMPNGKVLGKAKLPIQAASSQGALVKIPITVKATGAGPFYVTYKAEEGKELSTVALASAVFE
jgi:cytochrome c551/c552